jgi:hypothetical protein
MRAISIRPIIVAGLIGLTMLTGCGTPAQPETGAPAATPAVEAGQETGQPVTGELYVGGEARPYSIVLPAQWEGAVEVVTTESRSDFVYQGSEGQEEVVFSIIAMPEEEWAPAAEADPRHEIVTEDGVVFVYTYALDNIFSGEDAERFSALVASVPAVAESFQTN